MKIKTKRNINGIKIISRSEFSFNSKNESQIIDIPTASPFIPSLRFNVFIRRRMQRVVKNKDKFPNSKFLSKVEKYKVSILISL